MVMLNYNLLEKNPKRLYHMDIARFFAIVFMVLSHVQLMYGSVEFMESNLGYFFDILAGPPAAPVFMVLMGFFALYTKKTQVKPGLKRGLIIFLVGLILNLVRIVIPYALGIKLGVFSYEGYGATFGENILFFLFEVDILLFAGLAYGATILLLHFRPKITLPITFFIIAIVSPFLWGIYTNNGAVDIVLDLIWGNRAHVAFPLFPWLCYPILGAWIGMFIMPPNGATQDVSPENPQKSQKLGKRVFLVGLFLLILGLIIVLFDFDGQIADYYHSGSGAVFLFSGFVILWLFLLLNIMRLLEGRIQPLIEYISINLTSIYCIHWVILGWLLFLIPSNAYDAIGVLLIFGVVFSVSVLLTKKIKIKL
ncbi:MAG: DUF1624 domain-containing protein [Promethearchaeota archaeon]|nr:MAG: DUF1624 domain-containing protein [Candidatus Lokiarchaeota archaeon]